MIVPCRSWSGVRDDVRVAHGAGPRMTTGRPARSAAVLETRWCRRRAPAHPRRRVPPRPRRPRPLPSASRVASVLSSLLDGACGPAPRRRHSRGPFAPRRSGEGAPCAPLARTVPAALPPWHQAASNARSASTISWCSGNRSCSCFEKTIVPSATTSKMPFVPSMSSASISRVSFSAAARPAALGWYFQRTQKVIETCMTLAILSVCIPERRPVRASRLRVESAR